MQYKKTTYVQDFGFDYYSRRDGEETNKPKNDFQIGVGFEWIFRCLPRICPHFVIFANFDFKMVQTNQNLFLRWVCEAKIFDTTNCLAARTNSGWTVGRIENFYFIDPH